LTKQLLKNGNSPFEIDSADSEEFLDYLARESKRQNVDEDGDKMLSAQDFYNQF